MRLFADDSSLFACVTEVTQTHNKLVKDLEAITSWAHQWKMDFNPDKTKQAIKVIFSCKDKKPAHSDLSFNGIPIARKPFTKHLEVYLDSRLNFPKHIKEQVATAMKGLSLLRFLSKCVNLNVLSLSFKMYIRPHLDYGDVIYHNQRADLMELVERVQYKGCMKNWVGNPCPTDGGSADWRYFTKSPSASPPFTYLGIYPSVTRLAWFYETAVIMSPYLGHIDTKTVSFHTQLKLGEILMRKQNLNPLFRALKRILRRTTFESLGTLSLEFLTNTGSVFL